MTGSGVSVSVSPAGARLEPGLGCRASRTLSGVSALGFGRAGGPDPRTPGAGDFAPYLPEVAAGGAAATLLISCREGSSGRVGTAVTARCVPAFGASVVVDAEEATATA
ncbi:hypothetical protein [Nocardia stercoris]|uniref:Uncharacterized protein n=1 Tax=Nocardia stercoris TaxID=2483361 RepID=A0A3M2L545_9NOCA|nr:hypothetical protein [Nocardia stercoris]RMI29648.1 hypothetical protein EBN03_24890 [Nocardia stercoris]